MLINKNNVTYYAFPIDDFKEILWFQNALASALTAVEDLESNNPHKFALNLLMSKLLFHDSDLQEEVGELINKKHQIKPSN